MNGPAIENNRSCGTPPPIPVYGPSGTAEQFARAYGGISTEELSQIFEFRDHAFGGSLPRLHRTISYFKSER